MFALWEGAEAKESIVGLHVLCRQNRQNTFCAKVAKGTKMELYSRTVVL